MCEVRASRVVMTLGWSAYFIIAYYLLLGISYNPR